MWHAGTRDLPTLAPPCLQAKCCNINLKNPAVCTKGACSVEIPV